MLSATGRARLPVSSFCPPPVAMIRQSVQIPRVITVNNGDYQISWCRSMITNKKCLFDVWCNYIAQSMVSLTSQYSYEIISHHINTCNTQSLSKKEEYHNKSSSFKQHTKVSILSNYQPRSREIMHLVASVCLFVCALLSGPFDLPPWFSAWGLTLT